MRASHATRSTRSTRTTRSSQEGWQDELDHQDGLVRLHVVLRALSIFLLNVLLGLVAGLVFNALEAPFELQSRAEAAAVMSRYNRTRLGLTEHEWNEMLAALGHSSDAIRAEIDAHQSGTLEPVNWGYSSSMFFAFTIVTTVGYGSFTPATPGGRAFTIVYALVGIPLMFVAFYNLCTLLLKMLGTWLSGRKRNLPAKVFRMMDADQSGTLSKHEVLVALSDMGLGRYHGRKATVKKRQRFEAAFAKWDKVRRSTRCTRAPIRTLLALTFTSVTVTVECHPRLSGWFWPTVTY
jgi:hypothetical protein